MKVSPGNRTYTLNSNDCRRVTEAASFEKNVRSQKVFQIMRRRPCPSGCRGLGLPAHHHPDPGPPGRRGHWIFLGDRAQRDLLLCQQSPASHLPVQVDPGFNLASYDLDAHLLLSAHLGFSPPLHVVPGYSMQPLTCHL